LSKQRTAKHGSWFSSSREICAFDLPAIGCFSSPKMGYNPRMLSDITDITNTPEPRKDLNDAAARSFMFTPEPSDNTPEGALERRLNLAPGTSSVQRFTLRSRSARHHRGAAGGSAALGLMKEFHSRPASQKLRLPPRLRRWGAQPVHICGCSADPALSPGRRRLCQRDTNEHDEFKLLEEMNRCFINDSQAGGEFIISRACLRQMDTYFIVEPCSDTSLGYVAIVQSADHGVMPGDGHLAPNTVSMTSAAEMALQPLPVLTQLYVEKEARRKGLATAALRVVLAGNDAVVVDSPALAVGRAMLKLGFEPAGARRSPEGRPKVLFVRGGKDENM